MGKYNFDQVINRRGTNAEKWEVAENELPMWVADMDFQTAPTIIEALHKRIEHGAFGYSGIPDEWYDAYMNWWDKRHNFKIEKEWLIFSSGIVPAITSIVRKLTTPAEKVLIQTPVYNCFFSSVINTGRFPVESPLKMTEDGYVMDFERLEEDLKDPQISLMILCNPQNPGGKIWDKETLTKLANLCAAHGVKVLSDEAHCDLTDPGSEYVPFASVSDVAREISVTCLSPSKTFNVAGFHSAAVVVPNPLLRHKVWRGLNTDEVAEPNAIAIVGAVAAYNTGAEWLDELREYLYENKKYVVEFIGQEIPELKPIKQDATYLLWIDISKLNHEGLGFAKFLREKTGLYISKGVQYGQAGRGYLRINLACPRSTVEDGMKRLKEGVQLWQNK